MWDVRAYHNNVCFFGNVVCFFETIENFNLGYLKVRNDKNHGIRRQPKIMPVRYTCCTCMQNNGVLGVLSSNRLNIIIVMFVQQMGDMF